MPSLNAAALLFLSALAPGAELPPPEQVTALPPELIARLEAAIPRRKTTPEERLDKLFKFVFGREGLALEYAGDSTLTVQQLAQRHEANCLSFSLLFVSLARRLGLDAYVQETDHVLAWLDDGGDVYRAGHVNVGVRIGRLRHTVDIDRSLLVASTQPRKISDRRVLAHFYNNRGAELMESGDFAAAGQHLHKAIAHDPDFIAAWNNLGVTSMRRGDYASAERAYLTALQLKGNYAAALFNMISLYQAMGNASRADEFKDRLEKARGKDPFQQFMLAMESESQGDYASAIIHYQRAIRLRGREHHFHFGLARAYARIGNLDHAQRELLRARDLASKSLRGHYQAKLDRLQHSRQ